MNIVKVTSNAKCVLKIDADTSVLRNYISIPKIPADMTANENNVSIHLLPILTFSIK